MEEHRETEIERELRVQKTLDDIIKMETIKKLGGRENLDRINKELKKAGLTVERAIKMNNKEFTEFMKEHGIEVKK